MLKVGLQLYTVREEMEADFEGTLKKVAELGYQGVEFHTFFGRSSEEVQKLLTENGLVALGTHIGYDRMLSALDEEIIYNGEIGNKNLIVPYLGEEQRNWSDVFNNLKQLGARCHEQGVVLLYHNHEFELTESYGEQTVFDAMYSEVPANQLQVEMDTCWVYYGGYDPVAYIAKYAGRLPIIHLKDMQTLPDGTAKTVELGQGEVKLEAIVDAANQAGVEWIVVEQDYCENPPLESIATSMEWIENYAKNGGSVNV